MDLIRKSIVDKPDFITLKDLDDQKGIVQFYFAHFGSRDSDNDRILEGAYEKTIKENFKRIKHIKNHNTGLPLGKIQALYSDTIGGICETKMSQATDGRDMMIMYKEGIITEHSQGFVTVKEQFNEMDGVNDITEVALWEVSSLTAWGANENAVTIGMKSLKSKQDIRKAINLLKGLDNILHRSQISDEKGAELQKAFDDLSNTFKSLNLKPSEDTLKKKQPTTASEIDWSSLHDIKF